MYEHGQVALDTGDFGDRWDRGQVGWIYCLPATIRHEYGCTRITKQVRARVEAVLQGEVREYGRYVNGECFGYTVTDANDEVLDSCWGFIGYDYAQDAAREAAEACTIVEQP
jgi:hypothetical protein